MLKKHTALILIVELQAEDMTPPPILFFRLVQSSIFINMKTDCYNV